MNGSSTLAASLPGPGCPTAVDSFSTQSSQKLGAPRAVDAAGTVNQSDAVCSQTSLRCSWQPYLNDTTDHATTRIGSEPVVALIIKSAAAFLSAELELRAASQPSSITEAGTGRSDWQSWRCVHSLHTAWHPSSALQFFGSLLSACSRNMKMFDL